MKLIKKITTLIALSMPVVTLASCGFSQEVPETYQEKKVVDTSELLFENTEVVLNDEVRNSGYKAYGATYKGVALNRYSLEGVEEINYTCYYINQQSNGEENQIYQDIEKINAPGIYEITLSFSVNTKKYKEVEPLKRRITIVNKEEVSGVVNFEESDLTQVADGTAKAVTAVYNKTVGDKTEKISVSADGTTELPGISSYEYYYEGIDGTSYDRSKSAPAAVGTYKVSLEFVAKTLFEHPATITATLTINGGESLPDNVKISGSDTYTTLDNGNLDFGNDIVVVNGDSKAKVEGGAIKISGGKATTTQEGIKVNLKAGAIITVKTTTTKKSTDAIKKDVEDISDNSIAKLTNNLVALDASTGDVVARSSDYIVNQSVNPTPEIAIYIKNAGDYVIGGEDSGIYVYELNIKYDETDVTNYDLTVAQVKENYEGLLNVVYNSLDKTKQTEGNAKALAVLVAAIEATTTKEDALTAYTAGVAEVKTYTKDTNVEPETPAVPANVTYKASEETALAADDSNVQTTSLGLVMLQKGKIDGNPQRYNLGGQVKSAQNGIKFTVSAGCVVLVTTTLSKTSDSKTNSSDYSKLLEKVTVMTEAGTTVATATDYVGLTSYTYALYIPSAGTYILGGDKGGLYISEITIAYDKGATDVATYDKTLAQVKTTYLEVLDIVYGSLTEENKTTNKTAYDNAVNAINAAEDATTVGTKYNEIVDTLKGYLPEKASK